MLHIILDEESDRLTFESTPSSLQNLSTREIGSTTQTEEKEEESLIFTRSLTYDNKIINKASLSHRKTGKSITVSSILLVFFFFTCLYITFSIMRKRFGNQNNTVTVHTTPSPSLFKSTIEPTNFSKDPSFITNTTLDNLPDRTSFLKNRWNIETLSESYKLPSVEQFFKEQFHIEYPLVMAQNKKLMHDGWRDIQWWITAQGMPGSEIWGNSSEYSDYPGENVYKILEGAFNPNLYRATSLLTNYQPIVHKLSSFYLVFDSSKCRITSGAPHDVWRICSYTDKTTTQSCTNGSLPAKDGSPFIHSKLWTPEYFVFCGDDETSHDCMSRMYHAFEHVKVGNDLHHSQVQALCRGEDLVACSFDPDVPRETRMCKMIQSYFPHIGLIATNIARSCRIRIGCIRANSKGLQKVRVSTTDL